MGEKPKTIVEATHKRVEHEDLSELAEKRGEAIRDDLERAERTHKERLSESEALAEAKKLADEKMADEVQPATPAERRRGVISKKQLSNAYASQMDHAREHMSTPARMFSKFIHVRTIEAASDAIGSTIARPNALLSGSIAAFIAITILFFVAKHYGYQLSGFETIGAFIAGWILGILYDYFSLMIRGRRD